MSTTARRGRRRIETDYLVVGAGAAGMAFTDALTAESNAEVVLADRRHRPGGHWNDAYSFVRLHQPSAFYGVNSRVLGKNSIDRIGPNAGFYERASAADICGYFESVLNEQFLPSGRVRFLGKCEYRPGALGGHELVSLVSGEEYEVIVRRKLVDATYLETAVPATHTPSFYVSPGVRRIPVNDLVRLSGPHPRYVLVGGGKTAMDACVWLIESGVDADRIRWIRPRDSWLLERSGWQPLDRVLSLVDGFAMEMQAAAEAQSADDLFRRLESCGRLVRIDESVTPTMYHCATVCRRELDQLRQVSDVIRLGRVQRIEPQRIVLDGGTIPAEPSDLYIDCTAAGLRKVPARPIYESDRITIQPVRSCSPTFNAALIGYIEATRDDVADQNRLCPTNPYPDTPEDWMENFAASVQAAYQWSREPGLREWIDGSRLNMLQAVGEHSADVRMQEALQRYHHHFQTAFTNLRRLTGELRLAGASGATVGPVVQSTH
jgi:hypothetical protein